ncbi:MAG: universal stress protein [Duodenibacillus sp.]|nr:universal stress protein [Duodenibacillus sp.]
MKILVPIDGSVYSENSLAFVASRATLLGSTPEIELLVVLEPLPGRMLTGVGKDDLMAYYEDEAEKVFRPARSMLKDTSAKITESFVVGSPSEKIAEEAARMKADLIIMGSRGRTALAGLFMGSVTTGVLARTKLPILILRNKPAPKGDALRIGIAVDGSKYGQHAVKFALKHREIFGQGAAFDLINVAGDYAGAVMPDMAGMALPALSDSEIADLQKKEFHEAVDPLAPLFEKAGVTPKPVCLVGNPGDEIAAFARKKKLDLLVMGSHGYGRFKSAVMGSTAMRIAAQGDVPILLIRQ